MKSGLTGALFREFAFTLAGAVLISGFVALTLSPMMDFEGNGRSPRVDLDVAVSDEELTWNHVSPVPRSANANR